MTLSTDIINNGLKIIAGNGSMDIDGSGKTFDDVKYTHRLKLGGAGDAEKRALSFIPGANGTLKICALSSNGEPKTLTVEGGEPSSCSITSDTVSQTVNVTAGTQVTLYGDGGVNVYALIYTPSAE